MFLANLLDSSRLIYYKCRLILGKLVESADSSMCRAVRKVVGCRLVNTLAVAAGACSRSLESGGARETSYDLHYSSSDLVSNNITAVSVSECQAPRFEHGMHEDKKDHT